MGFLTSLFGGKKNSLEAQEQQREKNFDILKFDGLKAQKMGQMPYSVRCFTEALALKEDFETRLYLANSYIALQEYPLAFEQLQKLTEADPNYIETYLLIARVAEHLQDWQAMNDACQKAFLLDEKRAEVFYYFGEACHGLEDDISAIAMLTKAITLKDDFAAAYRLRADILMGMKQYKEAEEDIDYLLKLDAENESDLMRKAKVRIALGDKEQAIVYYNKVTTLNPFCDQAYLEEGALFIEEQELEKALSLYNEAIETNPNFAAAYKERGNVKRMLGDQDGSIEDVKKALELAPQESAGINGNFTNIEDQMNAQYRANNPFAQ